jgi:hypothetical protein
MVVALAKPGAAMVGSPWWLLRMSVSTYACARGLHAGDREREREREREKKLTRDSTSWFALGSRRYGRAVVQR